MQRRSVHRVLAATAVGALAALSPLHACAQAWPAKPLKIIVPYTTGGFNDTMARLFAQKLQEKWSGVIRKAGIKAE